jgi:imidazolonepropionase
MAGGSGDGNCNPGSGLLLLDAAVHRARRPGDADAGQALWSATAGGALALRRPDIGRLAPGARADLDVLDAPRHPHLSYRPDVPLTRTLDLDDLT